MPRPSRFRRRLKWTGVGVCVVTLVAWGVSLRWRFILSQSPSRVVIHRGVVDIANPNLTSRIHLSRIEDVGLSTPDWSYRFWRNKQEEWWSLSFPLYIPFLLTAIPTAFLFYLDRRKRIPPGHCKSWG